ncbi:MAG: BrnT family toxin [Rhizobiaceae bacterium]
MKFQWDETKAETNWRKHKIRFEAAVRVFLDPFALTEHDRIEGDEYRYPTLDLIDGTTILLVAHVDWEEDGVEIVRLISAREATPSEMRRYGKNRYLLS